MATNQNQGTAQQSSAIAKYENVSEQVLNKIEKFQADGGLTLPANYSVENHMKSAWLILQSTTDKNGAPALQVCTKDSIANALFEHLSHKLPVSRLQRDLTDSTVIRNVGVPLAHTIIAIQSTMKGLGKLLIHRESIDADLDNNWAVVAEAIQTILRREGYPHPYEALKALTRTNTEIRQKDITDFIKTLNVPDNIKEEL